LAAAPDERALRAIAAQLYSPNQVVARLAASTLQLFPESEVKEVIADLFRNRGPADELAYVVSAESFLDQRMSIARTCVEQLQVADPLQSAAAIKTLRFLAHTGEAPADANLTALADHEVLKAAPAIVAAGLDGPQRELALYLGSLKSLEAHLLLSEIAFANGSAAEQARISLTWNPEPGDLPKLASLLVQPGNPDPTGRNLSTIPYSLMRAFGDQAIPALEKAITDSPYVWVRASSARELARKSDPAAFNFFLDAIVNKRFYKDEMIRLLKEAFPTDLPTTLDERTVIRFLHTRLAT
jgi:hypothetical protein